MACPPTPPTQHGPCHVVTVRSLPVRWYTLHPPTLPPPADAASLGKPLIIEEFGTQRAGRDAYFSAAFQAVEASLSGGGPLKGALFWQFYAPGQVGVTGPLGRLWKARRSGKGSRLACKLPCDWCCRQPRSSRRYSLFLPAFPPPRPHPAPLPLQTASAGEGGGAGQFGIYPSDSTFKLVQANAGAVQRLAAGPSLSQCSAQCPAAAPACSDKG